MWNATDGSVAFLAMGARSNRGRRFEVCGGSLTLARRLPREQCARDTYFHRPRTVLYKNSGNSSLDFWFKRKEVNTSMAVGRMSARVPPSFITILWVLGDISRLENIVDFQALE